MTSVTGMTEMTGILGEIGLGLSQNINQKTKLTKRVVQKKQDVLEKNNEYKENFNDLINNRELIDIAINRLKKSNPNSDKFDFDQIITEVRKVHNEKALKEAKKTYLVN